MSVFPFIYYRVWGLSAAAAIAAFNPGVAALNPVGALSAALDPGALRGRCPMAAGFSVTFIGEFRIEFDPNSLLKVNGFALSPVSPNLILPYYNLVLLFLFYAFVLSDVYGFGWERIGQFSIV